MVTGIATIRPMKITIPRSACRLLAAAMGPGVGGTNVCVAYNPVDSAVAMTAMETPDFFDNDLFRADRMTKPESQNTGIDVI